MPFVTLETLIVHGQSGAHLISFPTDTVPALAVHPDHAHLIFEAKQRSQDKPLILMAATADDLWPYTWGNESEQAVWRQVAQQYWPGALTLVLPASPELPPGINLTGSQTVGLRVPDHAIAQYVLSQTGPLATTSVNRSGQPPLLAMSEIVAQFPEVSLLSSNALEDLKHRLPVPKPDSLEISSGTPSTVVQWIQGQWTVLRQGAVNFSPQ